MVCTSSVGVVYAWNDLPSTYNILCNPNTTELCIDIYWVMHWYIWAHVHQDGSVTSGDLRNCLGVSGITEKSLVWSYSGSQSPVRSEIPLRPAATLHLRPWHNVKKKRSPSSWRRSNQRLKSFLEKKNSQERQERGTVAVGESQESPVTPINAPPPPPPCWEIVIPWISSVTVW